MPNFPHLDGATKFPYDNVNVWKYENEFDYSRWPANVTVKAMSVPWCGDYDNVVKFASDDERDEWLDEQSGETFTLATMVHVVPGTAVKLPVPSPALQGCNYLVVDMPRFTDDGEPIEYAGGSWKRRYCYFMDDVVQRAASTTECVLRIDVWTTYINDLELSYAMLERGHAPVAATSVDEYLSAPIDNNKYLLAPDVSYGVASKVTANGVKVFNPYKGELFFVFCMSAYVGGNWGSLAEPKVNGIDFSRVVSVPGPGAWAVDASDAVEAIRALDAQQPQLLMCVQGAFFISKDLVEVSATYDVAGYEFYLLSKQREFDSLLKLSKGAFGYPSDVADFAKLYTYPYAKLEITDANGASTEVRIEDCDGVIEVESIVSLVMPWIGIDVNLLGVGGKRELLEFKNLSGSFCDVCGVLKQTSMRLSVPVYSISQNYATVADYTSDYDRAQAKLSADNALASALASNKTAYDNAVASATTARDNAKRSASTAQSNANRSATTARTNANNSAGAALSNAKNSASNVTANNAVSTALNSQLTAISNSAASHGATLSNNAADSYTTIDNQVCTAGYIADKEGLAVAATNNDIQAGANAVGNVVGAVASLATGNIGGAISGIGGAINAGIGWSAANASNAVSQSNADNVYSATFNANLGRNAAGTTYTLGSTNVQNGAKSDSTAAQNSANTSIASNNASLITGNANNSYDAATTNAQNSYSTSTSNASATKSTADANADASYSTATGNASRTKSTADANAQRAYNTAINAISNGLAQAGINAPAEWGARMNGEHATTRPLALLAQVVTQPTGAIMQAGAQFARWGYQLNQQWKIEKLQVMKHFTYWQCSEVYCAGKGNALEFAQQTVKDIFRNGVTVWSKPEEIGAVNIYDN